VASRSGIENAAASSARGGYWKNDHIWVVTVWKPAGRARIAGEPKRARACRTARMKPLRMAGSTIGKVIVRATCSRPAPRMAAASSRSEAIRPSVLAIMMYT
jgi:hypothetical protein